MAKKPASKATPKRSTTPKSSSARRSNGSKKPAARGSGKSSSAAPAFTLTAHQKGLLVGIICIFVAAILILSLLSPNQGQLTSWIADWLALGFGWGGAFVPLIVGGLGVYMVLWGMEQPPQLPTLRLLGGALLLLALEALATLWVLAGNNGLNDVWIIAAQKVGGGYLGGALVAAVSALIGTVGAVLSYTLLAIAGVLMAAGTTRARLAAWVQQTADWQARRAATATEQRRRQPTPDLDIPPNPAPLQPPATELRPARLVASDPQPAADPGAADRSAADRSAADRGAADRARIAEIVERRRNQREGNGAPAAATPAPAQPTLHEPLQAAAERGQWRLPVLEEMLKSGGGPAGGGDSIEEQALVIKHTLESFGAPGEIVEIKSGPTVTQFGVEPLYVESRSGRRMKVKVSKIASLQDDLALALAAKSVRIQAPVPGKGYIGIEVPNTAKSLVSLRDVMESASFTRINSPLRLGLGQDVAGNSIAFDLAKMPHLLIAGATGSGKSVCVNGIIACLLLNNTPDDLRFVMVDPKRVELTGYNGIPHLVAPVVVEMDRVVGVLQWALREMDQRYQLFASTGARNITAYNAKVQALGRERLPYIVVIIDELADLMMTAAEETERALARLAQMARATGIHMIIATQRPSVDVVTGLIKANFPARIAFAVSSSVDSRVVLDTVGAERLLGAGDMLLQRPDAPAPMRMQGCFVSDDELNKLIGYWRSARRFQRITAEEAATPRPAAAPPAAAGTAAPAGAAAPAGTAAPAAPIVNPPAAAVTTTAPPATPTAAPAPTGAPATPTAEPSARRAARTPQPTQQPSAPARAVPPAAAPPLPAPAATPLTSVPPPGDNRQQALWSDLIDEQKKDDQIDELWDEAVDFVRKSGKASTSMLQRRFRIGYTRAARMVDAMEQAGLIGPPTGTSKAREVRAGSATDDFDD